MYAWMRVLEVHLTSKTLRKTIVFGREHFKGKEDLNITVTLNKYLGFLKDNATIKIDNLSYSTIVELIDGKFYDVKIVCGYRGQTTQTIFDGGVLYISNKNVIKTNTVIILCASHLVASYGQSRMNLTLQSGINMYSAITFACRRAGISDLQISEILKTEYLREKETVSGTLPQWLEKLTEQNTGLVANSDSSTGGTGMIYNIQKASNRTFNVSNDMIDASGGLPTLTNDGLSLTMLPVFAFQCGDIIQLDNSIIDISANSRDTALKNYGMYLNKDGRYMIYEMQYNLQNRDSDFSVEMLCKSTSFVTSFLGGTNG